MRSSQNTALIEAFANELKARRNILGISQEELAFRSQVNRTFIAKLELAKNQPSLSVLLNIASGLGVELPELLGSTLLRYKTSIRLSSSGEKEDE
ncbi:MAG: transcriptional regulator [Candidatus Dactylopiibacterium carminicum]|uniref:Transcriptional regulator n=1 Tax=Candidatus Dactylopiibacterium carminicum TaxID=857335 RepID=A0A272EX04_9RHOO|nr:helix-turn-helix transcriptional regulator [Candidatus Dactylopiibacterium carminicum]KAF7600299.1 XRE family transcriptional regulator [Candidatus Dactylopiibacterium carminicum]PAS94647.1 MAG: transcriptional regulator [Candidatus Dactylopiibacterium carminicum]PAS96935.1 MAG: transcriptional regulator [Candidatus Dactylopiibacterium carminicum]PAT00301.1 MAG: hypothetical protein BSR46_03565 [Candidatus Dactylopiibacterium carminicum]